MSSVSLLKFSLVESVLGLQLLLKPSDLLGRLLKISLRLDQILLDPIKCRLIHVPLLLRCPTTVQPVPLDLSFEVFMHKLQFPLKYGHLLLQVFDELFLLLHQLGIKGLQFPFHILDLL